jgi:pimeloyl-ACP methyl ester carboxylesterase
MFGRHTHSVRCPPVVVASVPTRHTLSVDGEDLVAVHHAAESDRWLVFAHGFVSDKSGSYEGRCERAVAEGFHGVRFDHRGCGESDRAFGEHTLETRLADLRAVLDYFDPPRCVLFGSSFGGKVVLHGALGDERVAAVATRAPVTDPGPLDAYRSRWPEAFAAAFEANPFEAVERNLAVPVAIFHGRADDTVPVADSLDAAGALGPDTLCQLYADEGHSFSRAAEARMRDQLFDWLATIEAFDGG